MKRYLIIPLLGLLAIVSSCTKIPGHYINPSTGGNGTTGTTGTTGSTGSTGSTGGSTGSGWTAAIDTSKGYLPQTKGTYLKYREIAGSATDTISDNYTGNTSTINGIVYYELVSASNLMGVNTAYTAISNHMYHQRGTPLGQSTPVDFLFLEDNLAVGSSWTAPLSDNGLVNGMPAQIVGTITEKNVNRTVSGKTFNYVIHTTLQIQYDLGSGFINYGVYDYYIAKGVGVIECDANIPTGIGMPSVTTSTYIIDYAIK